MIWLLIFLDLKAALLYLVIEQHLTSYSEIWKILPLPVQLFHYINQLNLSCRPRHMIVNTSVQHSSSALKSEGKHGAYNRPKAWVKLNRVLQVLLKNSTWSNHAYLFFPEVILCKKTTVKVSSDLDQIYF